MSSNKQIPDREYQRDARAWSKFAGLNYTTCLRLMKHPLTQGILGERISARDLIRVLEQHPALSEPIWEMDSEDEELVGDERATHLGENGLWASENRPLEVSSELDYLEIILTAEVLRMFTRTSEVHETAYSYGLKHTAEEFLGGYLRELSYVSNGKTIWAAAALGMPVAEAAPGEYSLNANFGLDAEQVEYARRMRASESQHPRAHHHRPPGYNHLQEALVRYAQTGETPERWSGSDAQAEPLTSAFHEWLIAQLDASAERGAPGSREALAYDYRAGVRDGDHRVARDGQDLVQIMFESGADLAWISAAERASAEWSERQR